VIVKKGKKGKGKGGEGVNEQKLNHYDGPFHRVKKGKEKRGGPFVSSCQIWSGLHLLLGAGGEKKKERKRKRERRHYPISFSISLP